MPIMTFMTRYYHNFLPPHRLSSVTFTNYFFTAFLGVMLFLVSSCEEDPTKMGRGILPNGDFVAIASSDTFHVKSWTMYTDSVRSDNQTTSYLGQIYDPYFGTTTASFVSQVRLGAEWDYKQFTIDSVKLFLKFLTVSGAAEQVHYLKFSEIDEQLYVDSAYYSGKDVPLTAFSISDILMPELQADTINNVVIDIPIEFGARILTDTSMLFYNDSKPDFTSYFKGLFFELTSPEDPVMLSLTLVPQSSYGTYSNYFILYGHNEIDEVVYFHLLLDAVNRNASFNRYIHKFDDAVPGKELLHINDTSFLDTLSYVQTMNGVYTKLEIPGLRALKENPEMDDIAVNKARLIVPLVYDGDIYTNSTIPDQLYMRYQTNTGAKYIVPDYTLSPNFFDGTADTTNAVYKFNVATFVQGYLDDNTGLIEPELELFMSPTSKYNVILKANESHSPVKFEFTYTRF